MIFREFHKPPLPGRFSPGGIAAGIATKGDGISRSGEGLIICPGPSPAIKAVVGL